MEASFTVALLWLLFGATHIGLETRRVRAALVARLGEWGFVLVFAGVAAIAFALLVSNYAALRFSGAPGPGLGDVAALRVLLIAASGLGTALFLATLVLPPSPSGVGGPAGGEPRGLDRITRHPSFSGFILVALAHVLLARHLVGAVFFGGAALVAIVGIRHQEGKLLALRGEPYADYLAATSALPFAAVLSGRQRIVWSEIPWWALAIGVAGAWGLRAVHSALLAAGGWGLILAFVGGAAAILVATWLRRDSSAALGARKAVH